MATIGCSSAKAKRARLCVRLARWLHRNYERREAVTRCSSSHKSDTMKNTMKKETWKTIIQIVVSILSAALTALGTTSCMGHGPIMF